MKQFTIGAVIGAVFALATAVSAAPVPVVYYDFESCTTNASGIVDQTTNAFNSTSASTNAGVSFPAGGAGFTTNTAVGLSGSYSTYLKSDIDIFNIGITGAIPRTVSMWFNTANAGADQYLFSYGDDQDQGHAVKVLLRQSVVGSGIDMKLGTARGDAIFDTSLDGNTWNHFVLVFPDGGTNLSDFKVYVNGAVFPIHELEANDDIIGTIGHSRLRIGTRFDHLDRRFIGEIDEFVMYNEALSDGNILALFEGDDPENLVERTIPAAPVAPTGLSADTPLFGGVELVWNANTEPNVVGYTVYRGDSAVTLSPLVTTTDANYQDNAVAPGTTYFYAVEANANFNTSPLSDAVSATPLEVTGLYAVESYDYNAIETEHDWIASITGLDGGLGWWTPWEWAVNMSGAIQPGSITYPGLVSSGDRAYLDVHRADKRSWNGTAYTNSGETVWFSFTVWVGRDLDTAGEPGLGDEDEARIAPFVGTLGPTGLEPTTASMLLLYNDGTFDITDMGGGSVWAGGLTQSNNHLMVCSVSFSDTAGGDVFRVWLDPALINPDPGAATLTQTGDFDVDGDSFCYRTTSGMHIKLDEIRIGDSYAAVTPVASAEPAVLSIAWDSGDVVVGVSNLAPWVISELQVKSDLVYGTWGTVETFSGITETNVVVPSTSPANFYRISN